MWFRMYATLLMGVCKYANDWTMQVGTLPWASLSDTERNISFANSGNEESNPVLGPWDGVKEVAFVACCSRRY